MRTELLLQHIQESRPDVLWIKYDSNSNTIDFDQSLPNHSEITAAFNSYDDAAAVAALDFANEVKKGKETREIIIENIKADIASKLYQDLATFTVKMDELKAYINAGGIHIFNYLMSSLPDDLIAYTNDTATHTSYPVLTDEYTTGQTIAQYIVSKLV